MSRLSLFISNSKEFKRVTSVILCFFVFWIIIFGCFFYVISPQYLYGYNASIIDKVARLESISSPKIVLVGNSNVAFGFRSALLEDEFNMPVVNMGLHGGLSNAFHEQMAKINVQEGDIIILCHSNFSDDDTIADSVLAWTTVENHPKLWKYLIRPKDYFSMANNFSIYLKRCLKLYFSDSGNQVLLDTSYSRLAFNEYGDNVYSDYSDEQWIFEPGSITVPEISESCINRLNDLNDYLTNKGATLLIAGYPIGGCAYTPNLEEFDKFEIELKARLSAPVISHYRDYVFPEEDFFNSFLHLNSSGAKKRTQQLIEDLHAYLD